METKHSSVRTIYFCGLNSEKRKGKLRPWNLHGEMGLISFDTINHGEGSYIWWPHPHPNSPGQSVVSPWPVSARLMYRVDNG